MLPLQLLGEFEPGSIQDHLADGIVVHVLHVILALFDFSVERGVVLEMEHDGGTDQAEWPRAARSEWLPIQARLPS